MLQNINTLKQKFETGKRPTQQDFHDLIDSFVLQQLGVQVVTTGDVLTAPTGNKRLLALQAGTYNNLKLSGGGAAPGITVTSGEMTSSFVYLDYNFSTNAWTKNLTSMSGPPGPQGAPGVYGPMPIATGTAVAFTEDKIYGTFTAPVSGNITHSLTGAGDGVTVVIFHSGGAEPAYPAEWKKLAGGYAYSTTKVNTIYAQHIAGRVQYTIIQEV